MKNLFQNLFRYVILFLFITFIFWSCSSAPGGTGSSTTAGTPPTYSKTNRVAVIGDSISSGVNPDFSTTSDTYGWVHMLDGKGGGSYPAALSQNIHNAWADTWVILSNFSKSGSKASDWNSMTWLVPITNFQPDIVVVYIGGNDLLAYLNDGNFDYTERISLSNNFIGILDKLTNVTKKPRLLMVDYYDLFDGYSMGFTNVGLTAYASFSNISLYASNCNLMMSNIAANYSAVFADIYPSFFNHGYGTNLGAPVANHKTPEYLNQPFTPTTYNIHPLTAGHQKIEEIVLGVLKQ